MRAHHAIHGREIAKMLKAPPQDFSSRLITATSTDKPAELGNLTNRLPQQRRLVRRCRDAMDGTIERLPCRWLQQHATRCLGHRTGQHGGIVNPPRQDAVKGQTALEVRRRGKLPRFKAATAFQNPMPHLNSLAGRVPLHTFDGVFDAGHGHCRQQQPRDGLN